MPQREWYHGIDVLTIVDERNIYLQWCDAMRVIVVREGLADMECIERYIPDLTPEQRLAGRHNTYTQMRTWAEMALVDRQVGLPPDYASMPKDWVDADFLLLPVEQSRN